MKIGMILGLIKVKGKVEVVRDGEKVVPKKPRKHGKIQGHTPREIEEVNRRIDEAFEQARKGKQSR